MSDSKPETTLNPFEEIGVFGRPRDNNDERASNDLWTEIKHDMEQVHQQYGASLLVRALTETP